MTKTKSNTSVCKWTAIAEKLNPFVAQLSLSNQQQQELSNVILEYLRGVKFNTGTPDLLEIDEVIDLVVAKGTLKTIPNTHHSIELTVHGFECALKVRNNTLRYMNGENGQSFEIYSAVDLYRLIGDENYQKLKTIKKMLDDEACDVFTKGENIINNLQVAIDKFKELGIYKQDFGAINYYTLEKYYMRQDHNGFCFSSDFIGFNYYVKEINDDLKLKDILSVKFKCKNDEIKYIEAYNDYIYPLLCKLQTN